MVGIGFRKDFAEEMLQDNVIQPAFIEVAPENWIGIGGFWKKQFRKAIEQYPLYTHGLSLSIGSPDSLDFDFLKKVKGFLAETNAQLYSEHLSYSKCDNAHLYDLLPIPFTHDAVRHVAERIRTVQEVLERKISIEIVSYYSPVNPEMTEIEFINGILTEVNCDLLLDVNNVYVNAFNHNYDAKQFIELLPMDRVSYIHMAGHYQVSEDLVIDTHGEAIIDPVFDLFDFSMRRLKRDVPVLLERDFNIPELEELKEEMIRLNAIKTAALKSISYVTA